MISTWHDITISQWNDILLQEDDQYDEQDEWVESEGEGVQKPVS